MFKFAFVRTIKAIISLICAMLIIACSVAQFHHHDNDGRMVVFSCTKQFAHKQDIHNHNHIHHSTECSNCSSHGCHDRNHQDEKNCSLKINIVKPENKQFSKIIIVCMLITDLLLNACDIITQIFFIQTDVDISPTDISSSLRLRAPPSLL